MRYSQLLSPKASSLRLTTEHLGRGHDRLVAQPTRSVIGTTGTILGRNIPSAIEIGIEIKPTLPTLEDALTPAIVASSMPAAATRLRGMSRIDRDHRTTPFFGLVFDFRSEVRKRPRVHSALGLAAPLGLHALADVLEVFQHNRATWLDRLDDLLAQDVIGIATKPRPPALQFPHSQSEKQKNKQHPVCA